MYTAVGQYREAMGMHEDVLRLVVEGDDGDGRTMDSVEPAVARRHLDLLKAGYVHLKVWDKSASNCYELVRELLGMREFRSDEAFKGAVAAEEWSLAKDEPGVCFSFGVEFFAAFDPWDEGE